jgi:hypothetical protein
MNARRARRLMCAMAIALSSTAWADIDGSVSLSCTGVSGLSCDPARAQCSKVKPENDVAPVVLIDPVKKTVKTPYRTELLPIMNSVTNNEQLQLQGTAEKFAWSAVVNRKTGKVTVTIADRVGAYVIFGQCKAAGGA